MFSHFSRELYVSKLPLLSNEIFVLCHHLLYGLAYFSRSRRAYVALSIRFIFFLNLHCTIALNCTEASSFSNISSCSDQKYPTESLGLCAAYSLHLPACGEQTSSVLSDFPAGFCPSRAHSSVIRHWDRVLCDIISPALFVAKESPRSSRWFAYLVWPAPAI